MYHWLLAAAVLIAAAGGCSPTPSSTHEPATRASSLQPVALPDLSSVHEAVQAQARERGASLERRLSDPSATSRELADAYGELGMLLHAAGFLDAAEPAYRNAQALVPDDLRWPYYLAHIHHDRGALERAERAFLQVLALDADDLATLIWLGRLYLDQDRAADAERMFNRAFALAPGSVAVLAGLGRASLERQRYHEAVSLLEHALTIDPSAASIHSPLGMAYRALGQIDKAEAHLQQWSQRDILVPDPRYQQLDMLLESGLSYELRGVRALEAKDWTAAIEYFTKGLELTPENTSLRRSLQHKLGTALHLAGETTAAVEQFEHVVRSAPAQGIDEAAARAHYSLAVTRLAGGRQPAAIEHLRAAVRYQPTYAEAHLVLAETLRRTGRSESSLPHYVEAVRLDPQAVQARLGYALALIRLDRHQDARDWLHETLRIHPDRPDIVHLLARLLAVSPDDAVRDGQRAVALLQPLLRDARTTDLGETLAMALAETGDYDEAVAVQRSLLRVTRQGGQHAAARRIEDNLQLYERGRPSRTFWEEE